MAKALRMEVNEMKELFEDGSQAMRMNYYPPCPQPELAIGLNPHSDATGPTILLQVNETEGLQIRKDGMWAPVKPLPNAFVVNIGDMLEVSPFHHVGKFFFFVVNIRQICSILTAKIIGSRSVWICWRILNHTLILNKKEVK